MFERILQQILSVNPFEEDIKEYGQIKLKTLINQAYYPGDLVNLEINMFVFSFLYFCQVRKLIP